MEAQIPESPVPTPGSQAGKSEPVTPESSVTSGRNVTTHIAPGAIAASTTIEQKMRVPKPQAEGATSVPLKKEGTQGDEKVEAIFKKHEPLSAEQRAKIETARNALLQNTEGSSPEELFGKLQAFNKSIGDHWTITPGSLPKGSLFPNVSSPESTRLHPSVHANWLDDKRSFAGFMYPSVETRAAALETLMNAGVSRHAHLPNDFVVWLQHGDTGPVFPMSKDTFQKFQGEPRKILTEVGEVTVTYGEIASDKNGQLSGTIKVSGTIRGVPVTRTLQWPLDSLEIKPGLRLELVESTGDRHTYVYKDSNNQVLHPLEVNTIHWKDFEGILPNELHALASRLVEGKTTSAGCRAGVGRTGTLYVATKMLEWTKANPGKKMTNTELLGFIAEGRLNRDQQVVQTVQQMKLLTQYMTYLNDNPDLSLADRMTRLGADISSNRQILSIKVGELMSTNPDIREILMNPQRQLTAADEALLDEIYELLVDPITLELIQDPVVTPYGHTFEREAIMKWFAKSGPTCPLTRNRLMPIDLNTDLFAQRLKSLLMQRAVMLAPGTAEGEMKMREVESLVVNEPLPWSRMLSTVMPQNSYFVRRKGFGGTNDFVVELRGKVTVQKIGFRVNAQGRLQPSTPSAPSFATIADLVEWMRSNNKANSLPEKPSQLTKEQINTLNQTMGKSQFLANLHQDDNLMKIVKHLEQRFEDATVKKEVAQQGFVRASILPCSFPCFTYAILGEKGLNKSRVCLNNGILCNVTNINLPDVKNPDDCIRSINNRKDLTEEQKKQFLAELEKVKDTLDFRSGNITLFNATNTPVKIRSLSTLNEAEVARTRAAGYMFIGEA